MCVWCEWKHTEGARRKDCKHDRGLVRACKEWRCQLCGRAEAEIVRRPNEGAARGSCHYCDQPATTRDHIVPLGRSGPNAVDNYVPACWRCNRDKADRPTTCRCDWCVTAIVKYWPALASTLKLVAPTCEICEQSMAAHAVAHGNVICPLEAAADALLATLSGQPSDQTSVTIERVSGPLSAGKEQETCT